MTEPTPPSNPTVVFDTAERVDQLFNAIRITHNKKINEYFRDVSDTDLDSPRSKLKQSLLISEIDSFPYATAAMTFFRYYLEDEFGTNDRYYSIPISTYNIALGHLPQITLYFKQVYNSNATEETRYRAQTMQVSFRVRDSKKPTNQAMLRAIALDIKRIFATPIYQYRTGYKKMSYFDKKLGYEFKIRCRDELTGEKLIKDVMAILNDVDEFRRSELKISESAIGATSATTPTELVRVLGRSLRLPNRNQSVRFRFDRADYKEYPQKPMTIVKLSDVLV